MRVARYTNLLWESLAIDLSDCEYLDSTFLGCLVDLYKRFGSGRADRQRFEIIADQERCRALLSATQLHTVLPVREQPPLAMEDSVVLAPGDLDRRQLGQHIMECHRRLAELGGPN